MAALSSEALQHIHELLNALNCGAALISRDGHIIHMNAALARLMQRPRETLLGSDLHALYTASDDRAALDERLAGFDQRREEEFFLPLPDGGRLPVIVSGRPLSQTPPLNDYRIITVIDISRQKAAEQREHEQYQEVTKLSDTILEQALDLKHYSERLEERVRQRTCELREANLEAIYMLAVASETRDADTGQHVLRIRDYCQTLAARLGFSAAQAEELGYASILHDVGKIIVPDAVLKKPGPLTDEERAVMQEHTLAGERILSRKPFFAAARQIARSHHENWDGSGYPDKLKGEEIPLPARIVHVADVFDALTAKRVYKEAWPPERAVAEIRAGAGRAFDPRVVEAFQELAAAKQLPLSEAAATA